MSPTSRRHRPARRSRGLTGLALTALLVPLLSACGEYDGVTSLPLPFTEGRGDDALRVTIRLAEASGLTPNAEVKVDDVTVGRVVSLDVDGWEPVAEVALDAGVDLPANAVARVGQKSLLGAKFLELAPPAEGATGVLASGAEIAATPVGSYPQTEQVLASLSLVLNGSGLQQVRSIVDQLAEVSTGREGDARAFLQRFNTFISSLSAQRRDIVAVIERLDQVSATLAADDTLGDALEGLPPALTVLERNRAQLVQALDAVDELGATAAVVSRESGDDLVANLEDLRPTLDQLEKSGHDLVESLSIVGTFPFAGNSSFPRMFQGDYGNLFITLDVSPDLLARNLLSGFTLQGPDGGTILQGPPLGAGDGPPAPGVDLPDLPGLADLPGLVDGLTGGLTGGLAGGAGTRNGAGSGGSTGSGLSGLLPGLAALTSSKGAS